MSIFRAQSWPLLSTSDKNYGLKDQVLPPKPKPNKKQDSSQNVNNENTSKHAATSPQVRAGRLLWRHYYPEGGWGWVITVVGTLIHILGPGLQLSAPASFMIPASIKFHHPPLHTTGKVKTFNNVHGEKVDCLIKFFV